MPQWSQVHRPSQWLRVPVCHRLVVFRASGLKIAHNLDAKSSGQSSVSVFFLWNTSCLLCSFICFFVAENRIKCRNLFTCDSSEFTVAEISGFPLSAPTLVFQKVTSASVLTVESLNRKTPVWSLMSVAFFLQVGLYSIQLKNKRWTEQYYFSDWLPAWGHFMTKLKGRSTVKIVPTRRNVTQ